MKTTFFKRIILIPFVIFIFCAFTWSPIFACTISVLTDSSNTLFLNNEDYNIPTTRIWFVNGGKDYYAAAYVGFDNGWGQGGLNEKGLAYDWVAGAKKEYNPAKGLKKVKGNASERMLESCATVDEAIEFYKKYEEMSFTYAQIMIADKSGDSVLIGSKNGKIFFDKKTNSRGYGFCGLKLKIIMFLNSNPTISNGEKILEECMQGGTYATKYSNIFDLKNGDIYLYRFKVSDKGIRLNLFDELKKGEHYYDIPEIQKQIKMKPKPLKVSMTRFPLDNIKPAQNQEVIPEKILKKIFNDMAEGKMDKNDFTSEFWPQLGNIQEAVKNEVRGYGEMISATLLEREDIDNIRAYRYLVVFKNVKMIECIKLNNKNKVAWFRAEKSI